VESVRVELLKSLLARGIAPVISPVSRGPDGGPLNVNADDAAAAVATAIGARELLFISNVPGVMAGGEVLTEVAGSDDAESLIASGTAGGGMAPKLRAAARAAQSGVERVRIGGLQMLEDGTAGTRVRGAEAAITVGVA
jgi:acetylglutamate kinase